MLILAVLSFLLAVLAGLAGSFAWAEGLALLARVCFLSFLIMLAAAWAAYRRR